MQQGQRQVGYCLHQVAAGPCCRVLQYSRAASGYRGSLLNAQRHRLCVTFFFASYCRKGQWQTVAIPLQHFLLTWKGQLVEQRTEINAKRVISVGVSLAGGDALQPPGNFNLGLEWIKAERRLHGLQKQ